MKKYCYTCGNKLPFFTRLGGFLNCSACRGMFLSGYTVQEIWKMRGTKEKKELAKKYSRLK